MWTSLPSVPWMYVLMRHYTDLYNMPLQILNSMLDKDLLYQIYTLNIHLSVISFIIFKHIFPLKFLFQGLASSPIFIDEVYLFKILNGIFFIISYNLFMLDKRAMILFFPTFHHPTSHFNNTSCNRLINHLFWWCSKQPNSSGVTLTSTIALHRKIKKQDEII